MKIRLFSLIIVIYHFINALSAQGTLTGPTLVCGTQTVTYCYSGTCNCPASGWQVAAPQTANFSANVNPNCINVSFPTFGVYTLEYVIGSGCNCTAGNIISLQVTVIRPINASFTTYDFCENSSNTVNFKDTSGYFKFEPLPTDGAIINPLTGIIANAVPGNSYTIEHVTGAPCNDSAKVTITCIPASDPRCSTHPCNLIKNGDFEVYNACPAFGGEIQKANDWYQGEQMIGSTDFFHQTCGFVNVGGGITPPTPYPGGVGCAGVYVNYNNTSPYYKEAAAQKLQFCAGQKYRLDVYLAKPFGFYSNLVNNFSFQIGNCSYFPTTNYNPTTLCFNGFIQATSVNASSITTAWQPFTRTFTASQNADAFLITATCAGPTTVSGYVFFDKVQLKPIDTILVTPTSVTTCDSANFTITIPGDCYGPYDVTVNNGTMVDTLFNINSGYTYTAHPVQNTTYTFTSITNKFSCTTSLNIPVTVIGGSLISSTVNANICTGNTYTLPGGNTVSVAGTYRDSLTSTTGCDSVVTTILSVNNTVTSNQNISICQGNNYVRPGGTTVSIAGTYTDTVLSSAGCDSIITTTLSVNAILTGTQSAAICSGNNYTLPGGSSVNTAGTYYDTLSTINGCDSLITTTITINPLPTATANSNTTITQGNSATLTASGGGTYNWTPSSGLNTTTGNNVVANPLQTTLYCVIVNDNNGCSDSACVIVKVDEIPCSGIENLGLPTAFSPNGDNINDEFCLQGWDACVKSFNIRIYDRWGEKVFESLDPNFCWDGTYHGKFLDASVFVYKVNAIYINVDKTVTKKGNISLIK